MDENNLANDKFGVDDICVEMGVSKVQLYRKLNGILNCSVNDYIVNTRINKAKFYLRCKLRLFTPYSSGFAGILWRIGNDFLMAGSCELTI